MKHPIQVLLAEFEAARLAAQQELLACADCTDLAEARLILARLRESEGSITALRQLVNGALSLEQEAARQRTLPPEARRPRA